MLTVYSKPNCPYCEQAKAWLDKNEIEYEVVDITVNTEARDMLVAANFKQVPQIYYKDRLFVVGGFAGLNAQDPEKLKARIANQDDY